ncbi:hypothetical protein [Rhodohalobacter halophilus]|uniref:hypothetical protein n=1 Tax=Rhodohalobacter halophilus TaxID=1812810 RepID=UPI00083F5C75|nr:hypothetical protein [Rhodohalobacter halophilus]
MEFRESHKKCIWSGKESNDLKPVELDTVDRIARPVRKTLFVLPQYEDDLKEYNRFVAANAAIMIRQIAVASVLLIFTGILAIVLQGYESAILITTGALTVWIGLVIINYPISTPETAELFGLKKAIRLARFAGYFTVAMGGFILWMALSA